MSKDTESCENCRYWGDTEEEQATEDKRWCHRYPKQLKIHKTDWCGEHRNEAMPSYKLDIPISEEIKGEL